MTLPSGTKLGSYEIRSALGAGGMGEVYRASDAKLKRDVALTGAGGVIALVVVNGLVLLVRLTLEWPGSVPAWAVAAGLIVSICVGLVFGVWPAMKAAKLDPVEALRYE
jgi:hypothetical protein